MSISIRGMLKFYGRKSMHGLMIDDKGNEMTDAQVRAELQHHLSLGHTALPMCAPAECPDFDYIKGCCPGHGVHYYDDNDIEISKEQYESMLQKRK